ncbi:unnamed protein product [Hymenolepis diminuta]|uniref:PHD-type domain-containing protein n=1 Tax=Hymenolepis diminuta TaxID=6216 RepID=A0A0R3ST40_HYMDI|nr:unnamed protein product [Hymenolepis diminuta]
MYMFKYTASGLTQKINPDKKDNITNDRFFFGFEIQDIKEEIRRGRQLRCFYCDKTGACVGCISKKCRATYHLPCLFESKGFVSFDTTFDAFCYRHRPKQDLSQRLITYEEEAPTCCVCLFSIIPETSSLSPTVKKVISECNRGLATLNISEPSSSTMVRSRRLTQWKGPSREASDPLQDIPKDLRCLKWLRPVLEGSHRIPFHRRSITIPAFDFWSHGIIHGGCCRPAWMHRDCIAGYGRSAGLHHLKCPFCSDTKTFIPTVVRYGVWVPDRDASWELEPPTEESEPPVEQVEQVSFAIPGPDSSQGISFSRPEETHPAPTSAVETSHVRSRRHTTSSRSGVSSLRHHNRERRSHRHRPSFQSHPSSKKSCLTEVEEYDDENKENIEPRKDKQELFLGSRINGRIK